MIRRAVVALSLTISVATPAAAQEPLSPSSLPSLEFLPRSDFHLSAAVLGEDDERFSWDTHIGGDFDLVDYGIGRFTFLADYQAVLGDQRQRFDPTQGNFTLTASLSARAASNEFGALLYHQSRHLSDRPKDFGISVNVMAGQILRRFETAKVTIDLRGDAGRVTHVAYLDYTWTANAEVVVRRQARPHLGVFGRLTWQAYGVDPEVAGRQNQYGGHIEGGVRVAGAGGALELFAGYEKVVDADPIERQPRQWAFAGFRVLNR